MIGGVNDNDQEMDSILSYLKENQIAVAQVNLLPYHDIASSKYERLDEEYKARSFMFQAMNIWKLYRQNFNKMDSRTQK